MIDTVWSRDLPTPYLAFDQSIVERNIERVMNYAKNHNFKVRAHVKAHKSCFVAAMQLRFGATGLAVAKPSEYFSFLDLDCNDVLIAYPPVGKHRVQLLHSLIDQKNLLVTVDSTRQVDYLAQGLKQDARSISILIEVNTGLNRSGISTAEEAGEIGELICKYSNLRLAGALLYNGHLWGEAVSADVSFENINAIWEPIYEEISALSESDLIVTTGSSPSLFESHKIKYVNEIRYGTSAYNDFWLMKQGSCNLDQCAGAVVATVVSDAVQGRVMIDAGAKAISPHFVWGNENFGYGYIVEYPDACLFKLHEEIGWIDVSRCEHSPKLGERLSIVPAMIGLTVNQFDCFYMINGERISLENIDARGQLL
jgi:D-serine deaminase-like pyridoxal phosphate-dependent protein